MPGSRRGPSPAAVRGLTAFQRGLAVHAHTALGQELASRPFSLTRCPAHSSGPSSGNPGLCLPAQRGPRAPRGLHCSREVSAGRGWAGRGAHLPPFPGGSQSRGPVSMSGSRRRSSDGLGRSRRGWGRRKAAARVSCPCCGRRLVVLVLESQARNRGGGGWRVSAEGQGPQGWACGARRAQAAAARGMGAAEGRVRAQTDGRTGHQCAGMNSTDGAGGEQKLSFA